MHIKCASLPFVHLICSVHSGCSPLYEFPLLRLFLSHVAQHIPFPFLKIAEISTTEAGMSCDPLTIYFVTKIYAAHISY